MKLKYKKLVIIITVLTFLLAFFILTLIPTGGSNTQNAEDAELELCKDQEINELISSYFAAKKTVNTETLSGLVSDVNRINKEKLVALAEYVEDYQNVQCYTIRSEDLDSYRVYAKYSMKLKNINTLAPCLSAFYVTTTSEGKYVIYLSALDEVQEEFIQAADKNENIVELKQSVEGELQKAIAGDASFKALFEKMNSEIKNATGVDLAVSGAAVSGPASGSATE
ncbi:MAG: hypothetical protein K6G62_05290 [Eubacterium sp.]|nr:hypothetical protein [Eubacterium sp.]